MTTNAERDVSANTQTLIDLLRKRDALGLAKYGVSLDRTDLSATDWIQHAVEELLDGAAYLTGLKRTLTTLAATSDGLPMVAGVRIVQIGRGVDGWFVLGQRSEADGGSEVWLSNDGDWQTPKTWDLRKLYWPTREAAEVAVRQFAEREAAVTIGPQRAAPSSVAKIQAETKQAAAELATQEPAGRELPDGPGFWQRYGEKWVIRQHTESMFFGCHCDANGYLGRTIAVLPKGGWRRADAGDATVGSVAYYEPQLEMLRQALTTAQAELAEACRRLKVLEPLGPNIAENLGVVESDGDFDFVLIRIPLAQAREMLAALTWEEPNDG